MKIVFYGLLGIVLDSQLSEQLLSRRDLLRRTVLPHPEDLPETGLLLSGRQTGRLDVEPGLLIVHDVPADILSEHGRIVSR